MNTQHIPAVLRHHARLLGHIVFWLAVLAFYTLYIGQQPDGYGQSLIFVAILLPITIVTTYVLLYWLIPRYLLTRRYGTFVLYFCYTLLLSLYLELMLVLVLYITVSGYQAMVVKPGVVDLLNVIVGMYLVVFLAAALHLLKRWYAMQALTAKLDRGRLEAELKLKEAELKLLKAQIHPHFLFNTLNNLYSLTLQHSDQAPEVVLRLSDLLDYMLYRGNAPLVALADEVEQIENYLALERLRYDDRVEIVFETQGGLDQWAIAPLLLMPFVENSFKHGPSRSQGQGWVHITLTVEAHTMAFVVENSKGPDAGGEAASGSEGIGLSNVQQRLAHLYPDRHQLDSTAQADQHRVALHLELDTTYADTMPPRR